MSTNTAVTVISLKTRDYLCCLLRRPHPLSTVPCLMSKIKNPTPASNRPQWPVGPLNSTESHIFSLYAAIFPFKVSITLQTKDAALCGGYKTVIHIKRETGYTGEGTRVYGRQSYISRSSFCSSIFFSEGQTMKRIVLSMPAPFLHISYNYVLHKTMKISTMNTSTRYVHAYKRFIILNAVRRLSHIILMDNDFEQILQTLQ